MAITNFTDFSNITYCGEEAQKIFAQDVYALDMRDYGITMMDGLKGKRKIYTGKIGDVWQKYSCPFTPQGEASLAEAFIEPVAVKANIEECYDAFWDTFLVEQTSISLQGGIPQTFSEWYFGKLREMRLLLGDKFDVVSMKELGLDPDIDENGETFEENALQVQPTSQALQSLLTTLSHRLKQSLWLVSTRLTHRNLTPMLTRCL